jgi:hypothetical protein
MSNTIELEQMRAGVAKARSEVAIHTENAIAVLGPAASAKIPQDLGGANLVAMGTSIAIDMVERKEGDICLRAFGASASTAIGGKHFSSEPSGSTSVTAIGVTVSAEPNEMHWPIWMTRCHWSSWLSFVRAFVAISTKATRSFNAIWVARCLTAHFWVSFAITDATKTIREMLPIRMTVRRWSPGSDQTLVTRTTQILREVLAIRMTNCHPCEPLRVGCSPVHPALLVAKSSIMSFLRPYLRWRAQDHRAAGCTGHRHSVAFHIIYPSQSVYPLL